MPKSNPAIPQICSYHKVPSLYPSHNLKQVPRNYHHRSCHMKFPCPLKPNQHLLTFIWLTLIHPSNPLLPFSLQPKLEEKNFKPWELLTSPKQHEQTIDNAHLPNKNQTPILILISIFLPQRKIASSFTHASPVQLKPLQLSKQASSSQTPSFNFPILHQNQTRNDCSLCRKKVESSHPPKHTLNRSRRISGRLVPIYESKSFGGSKVGIYIPPTSHYHITKFSSHPYIQQGRANGGSQIELTSSKAKCKTKLRDQSTTVMFKPSSHQCPISKTPKAGIQGN